MHQTHYHASWRISRPTTIEPEPQADIVPTGEVRAAISPRLTSSTSRKRAYFGARLMRGIYFPSAIVISDVFQNDPAAPKKRSGGADASLTDTYANLHRWEWVESAAVALTDGVGLLLTPGRLCQNGKPVPSHRADFQKFARDKRAAGLAVLQAARSKSQEKVSDATKDLVDACESCHKVYRDKGVLPFLHQPPGLNSPARCTPPLKK